MPIKRKSIREIVAAKKKQDEKDLKNKFAAERRTKGEYPPLIATMLKRLKRIDPWMGAIAMNKYDAILIFFFKEMNLDKIYAHAHSENVASNHTLKKLGFVEKGTFEEQDGTCIWYEIENN